VKAGIDPKGRHDQMPVRWHDLRHTCGASLISGWWGRAWRLEEIKELLGHKDISVTQRYAHLAKGALLTAADETDRLRRVMLATEEKGQVVASVGGTPKLRLIKSE
jgi:integrase